MMNWLEQHLSDESLLLISDGELSPRRLRRARTHLGGCQVCRTRLARIEHTLAQSFETQSADADRPLPPADPARARLARRMAEGSGRRGHPRAPLAVPDWPLDRQWVYGAAIVLVALASGVMLNRQRVPLMEVQADASGVFLLPRADLTPGASAPVTLHDICGPDRQDRTQPIASGVHQAIFTRYGADYRRAADYELDYLITPELGGVADARNLWPQPFTRTSWNAYVKDELERLLHRLVCEGKIELATAQREMASDWIAAYKRYFDTNSPLRDYEAAPLTALDRDFILSELEELGISAAIPPVSSSDGRTLMTMLQRAREQSHRRLSQAGVELAVFRLRP
jgi:hypothetical protein